MRALVLTVSPGEVELASDALWALGVDAVEERALDDGRVELWTMVGGDVDGRVPPGVDRWDWRSEEVDPRPVETWRGHAEPVLVADSVMTIPAWRDDVVPGEGVVAVRIEPAASFGLGDHPTTRLCLEHLVEEVRARPQCRVLDVGCGSGVLAIAAVLLGAAGARGIDVSTAAVEAARDNATRNGVAGRASFDGTPARHVEGVHEVVVANILAPVLVSLADELRRLCTPGGSIVIGGVLADRHDHVLAALAPAVPVRTTVRDGWAAVTLRR